MEVLNDLVGFSGLKIYQDDEWFRFSLESILLPNFVNINLRDKKVIDLCTGNAPIPLVLSTKTQASIYGVEVQKEVCDLANKTILFNSLTEQIKIINDDVNNLRHYFNDSEFDVVTVNPPYFKYKTSSFINKDNHKTIARHECFLSFNDIVNISYYLLKNNGRLNIVHRTERFVEIIDILRKNGFEPKRLQFIYPNEHKESKLFMLEAVKNGKSSLKLLPPLYIHNEDGTYRDEILKMFKRGD